MIELFARRWTAWEVADSARSALAKFLDGSARFTPADLARWLVTGYGSVARTRLDRTRSKTPRSIAIEWRAMYADMHSARADLRALVALSRVEDVRAQAHAMIDRGAVEPYFDRFGEQGFVPVDLARLDLRERLRSLWAVEYLVRPVRSSRIEIRWDEEELGSYDSLLLRGTDSCRTSA